MVKKVIYLHIEKSAGTSFRVFSKNKVRDEQFVFWWNPETKDTSFNDPEFKKAYIVGGHRNIGFYKNMDALYLGVVREPKERVISLFNYHSTKDVMQADGFDASSLEKTIENCKVFRNKISNRQCRFLGGRPSFESVLNMIKSRPFIVGSFDHIEKFNESFFGAVDVPVESFSKANVGQPGYKEKLALSDDLHAVLDDLLEEDYKLYRFINNDCDGLYENKLNKVDWFEVRKAFYNERVVTANDVFKRLASSHDLGFGDAPDAESLVKSTVEQTFSTIRDGLVEAKPGEVSRFPGVGRFVRNLGSGKIKSFEYYQAPSVRRDGFKKSSDGTDKVKGYRNIEVLEESRSPQLIFKFAFEPSYHKKLLPVSESGLLSKSLESSGERTRVAVNYMRYLISSRVNDEAVFWANKEKFGIQKGSMLKFSLSIGDGSLDKSLLAYDLPSDAASAFGIPDHKYFREKGYSRLRVKIFDGGLDDWKKKQPIAFWRGTTTGRIDKPLDQNTIFRLPRYELCRISLNNPDFIDARITKVSPRLSREVRAEIENDLRGSGILGSSVDFLDFSKFKYLVEIDGNVTPWSFLQKLMLGSCVLRVESDRKQWYYDQLEEWVHYVPVKQDMSDLIEKIQWCKDNDDKAREIAKNGQRFADSLSFDSQMNFAAEQLLSVASVVEEK